MTIKTSIQASLQVLHHLSLVLVLIIGTMQAVCAQVDTSYHSIGQGSDLLLVIDTIGSSSQVDSIKTCHEGLLYGTYQLVADSLQYTAGNAYGIDTLCSQVFYQGATVDSALYIITVMPDTDTVSYAIEQNASISLDISSIELVSVDSVRLCHGLTFGSMDVGVYPTLVYYSGYVSGEEEVCVVAYGDDGLTDTVIYNLTISGLPTPGFQSGEWFIDNDPGIGSGNIFSLPSDTTAVVALNIPLVNVPNGLHTLFVRVLNSNGFWSFKQQQLFFKQQGGGINDVSQMEYYIDVDPGYGNGKFLPSSSNQEIDVTFNVDIDELPAGLHTLFIRAKNEQNYWSFSAAHTFFKVLGHPVLPKLFR